MRCDQIRFSPLQLSLVTHIVVDEVHERSEDSDFLLMILRGVLRKRPGTNSLMSFGILLNQLHQLQGSRSYAGLGIKA